MSFERPEVIRPPSEWKSYYLPLTAGCSNNTCIFCTYYGSKLKIRDLNDVKMEIEMLPFLAKNSYFARFFVNPYWDKKRVFLQDADALVYPFPKLKEVLTQLNKKYPPLERVASYATPQDLLRRKVEELDVLKELKLEILYMGVESGHEEVLKKVGKRVNYKQIVEAARRVKKAGIKLSVTVILGLGGNEVSEKHALETAKILSDIDPDYAAALTLILVPDTPLYREWEAGDFHLISPFRSLEELRIIIENSNFTNCFFTANHPSNYLPLKGRMPEEKESTIKKISLVLEKGDPSFLKPEALRGL